MSKQTHCERRSTGEKSLKVLLYEPPELGLRALVLHGSTVLKSKDAQVTVRLHVPGESCLRETVKLPPVAGNLRDTLPEYYCICVPYVRVCLCHSLNTNKNIRAGVERHLGGPVRF